MRSGDHIFLIGPGGVGKTTTGAILGRLLGRPFIDLDDEFCRRIDNIGEYIRSVGYEAYVRANASLLADVVRKRNAPAVIALSSGALVTDVLPAVIDANRRLVRESGTAVVLLPGRDVEASAQVVVERQMQRGFNLKPDVELRKFRDRMGAYLQLASFRVDSSQPPEHVARAIRSLIEVDGNPAHV